MVPRRSNSDSSLPILASAGATAVYPLDIAKTQLQMDKAGKFTGLFNALSIINSEGGMSALYRRVSCTSRPICLEKRVHTVL